MNIVDHAYLVVAVVLIPVVSFVSFRRLLQRVAAGETVEPMHLYRSTALYQWILMAVLVVAWILLGRPFTALGFTLELDLRLLAGVALTIAAVALLLKQLQRVRNATDDELDEIDGQLGELRILFPRDRRELAGFYGMSVTAGIVEETIWRGFLFWYLGMFMPLWAAAIVSALGFGIEHAYQGLAAVPRVTLAGAAFPLLYLVTGSLWLPILLHVAVDVLQGRTIFVVSSRERPAGVEA